MSGVTLRALRVHEWIVVVVVVLVPVGLWRHTNDVFDLPKASVLWVASLTVGLLMARETLCRSDSGRRSSPSLFVLVGPLVVGLAISTMTSSRVAVSMFGQAGRYTGLFTLASCLMVFSAIARSSSRAFPSLLTGSLCLSSTMMSLYAWLQFSGNDPFEWVSQSFGAAVFSSMGNPNTSAFWIASTLPLFVLPITQPSSAWWVRALGGSGLGLCLVTVGILNSFQANIGVLAALVVLVIRVWQRPLLELLLWVPLLVVVLLLPFGSPSSSLFATGLLGTASCSLLPLAALRLRRNSSESGSRRLNVAGLAVLTVAGLSQTGRVSDWVSAGLKNGFVERGDFYRAARGVFADSPIFGRGLETFGFYYTEYRPVGAARVYEGSVTSSAHSIPLGFLAGGGLLLLLSYLFFIAVVLWIAIPGFRRADSERRGLIIVVGTAWLTAQVQSLVSVENVGVFVILFALSGLLVLVSRGVWNPRVTVRRLAPAAKWGSLVGVVLLVFLISWVVLLRPIRSSSLLVDSYDSFNNGQSMQVARDKIEESVRLSQWDYQYWSAEADFMTATGDYAQAAESARRALELSNYNRSLADFLIRALSNGGFYSESIDAWFETLKRDPFAEGLRSQAVSFFVEAGQALKAAGDATTARAFFDATLMIDPTNEVALQG